MIIDHGLFIPYRPGWESASDQVRAWIKIGALFLCNELGVDWYTIAHAGPTGRLFVSVADDGRVASAGPDPEQMFPSDHRVFETDQPVELGWYLQDGVFAPRQVQTKVISPAASGAPADV